MRALIAFLMVLLPVDLALAVDGPWRAPSTVEAAKQDCAATFISLGGNELQCFVNHVRTTRLFCNLSIRAGELAECISWAEASLKSHYDIARPKTAKSKAGTDALKELYVFAVSGLRGMRPAASEGQFEYDRRQRAREQATEDLIVKLQVEQPLAAPPQVSDSARAQRFAQNDKVKGCQNEAEERGAVMGPDFLQSCLAGTLPPQDRRVVCTRRADRARLQMVAKADYIEQCLGRAD